MPQKESADIRFTLGPAIVYAEPLPCPLPRREARAAEQKAVRRIIGRISGNDADLCHTPAGAPFIRGVRGSVSISHGGGYALAAVSTTGRVGIDIEIWRPELRRIAPKFMTPEEQAVYGCTNELLLQAWTSKEAIFKVLGIDSLTVSAIILPEDPSATKFRIHGQRVEIYNRILGNAFVTLAAIR